jgi:prepilin-type processing-associated H-X9-DG protein
MDKDYYSGGEEDLDDDFEYDASGEKLSGGKIFLILLALGILGACACGILGSFLASSLMAAKEKANKPLCANSLKGIGIAMILYSNDYRFFPHMQALNVPNKSTDVAKVYRTLIYFKYLDNAEVYICPSSEDFIQPSQEMINDPKKFGWKGVVADGRKPIHSGPGPDLFTDPDFLDLSYTCLRRSVSVSAARSDTMIAADKAIKDDFDSAVSSPYSGPVGNHSDGFNILYGDGHVNFASSSETTIMTRMVKRLHMGAFDPSGR